LGINATTQEAKSLDVIPTKDIDLVITIGKPGRNHSSISLRAKSKTWEISACGEPSADVDAFRHARDEINRKVSGLFLDYWRNLA
jgi:hypothetical protein